MRVLFLILLVFFLRVDDGVKTNDWLAWFDRSAQIWLSVPLDNLDANPVPLDYPPYPLLWSETAIAYVDDTHNLMIETDDTTTVLLEDADVSAQAWSHDGRFLAYAYTADEVHQLIAYDLTTNETIPLFTPLTIWQTFIDLRWSPNDSMLAAYLAYPPLPEAVLVIDPACLEDAETACTSTRLYDPAEDEATGVSPPIWRNGEILYACSGQLCIMNDDGLLLQSDDQNQAIDNFLRAVAISPQGDFALVKKQQGYQVLDTDGAIVAEYPLDFLTMTEQVVSDSNATATLQQFTIPETSTPSPTSTPMHPTLTFTPTDLPTNTSTPLPEQITLTPVTSNAEWTPYERDFNGVTMVLVPAGCFMMGSNDNDYQKPVHEQCFNESFWIDKYEVTQGDFIRLGGQKARENEFVGERLPVETITWFEARDFCMLREARLPTEAEWEYAARGPDSLVYPWGNDFVAENVVDSGNSNNNHQNAEVGSKPGGASWVGVLDMSGNVWEWMSSLYQDYPYSADYENNSDTNSTRVLRGGPWSGYDFIVRATFRVDDLPTDSFLNIGFRCVRP